MHSLRTAHGSLSCTTKDVGLVSLLGRRQWRCQCGLFRTTTSDRLQILQRTCQHVVLSKCNLNWDVEKNITSTQRPRKTEVRARAHACRRDAALRTRCVSWLPRVCCDSLWWNQSIKSLQYWTHENNSTSTTQCVPFSDLGSAYPHVILGQTYFHS